MQCIFFQRNVTCTVHCNRHILSAVNFHNHHTDDDRCTVEMCLLKFKKLHYFKKLLRSWPFQEIRITKVPSITDSGTPLVNDWNHVFPGTLADAWRSWLLNLAASAIIATAVTSGLCLKHNVVDRLEDSIQYCYLTINYLIFIFQRHCQNLVHYRDHQPVLLCNHQSSSTSPLYHERYCS